MAQLSTIATDHIQSRRTDSTERFVAFAFAAADLVLEVEPSGRIAYAAGAFRARLGEQPDAFVNRPVHSIISPVDHAALDAALMILREKGRLAPVMVRLAAPGWPQFALAGLALAPVGAPAQFCLTLAQKPAPLQNEDSPSLEAFARIGAARIWRRSPCTLGFLEVANRGAVSSDSVRQALQAVAPHSVASELAPGRFGVLGLHAANELPTVLKLLEEALRGSAGASVSTRHVLLPVDGLSLRQAARALAQALVVFARAGQQGLEEAGFAGGLAGYIGKASTHAGALRRAIKDRRFELLFQPVVSLEHRTLHHYEALVRPGPAKNGEYGSPQEFVLLVETLGLAAEFDLAVAELAGAAASRAPVPVAFNVCSESVQDPKFRHLLVSQLAASPACRAGRLMVEMTETAALEDLAEAARTVEALRGLKVPFCLDDFGAGPEDAGVLRAVTADTVKIDGSFVRGVAAGGRDRAFVAGLIDVARAAGASAVAERIETDPEAAAMHAAGATYGQGWLFGKPGPLPQQQGSGRRKGEREGWG